MSFRRRRRGRGPGMGRSLQNHNFRLYLVGQGLSQTGMWIQQTAELWVIHQLTGSGTALGIHAVLRFGPLLLFGVYGGLVSDRHNRRKLLITTQALHAAATGTLAVMVWFWSPTALLIYGVVLTQGVVNAIDNPVRRSFLWNLASKQDLGNAVSLHGALATVSRSIGPALAGLLITTVGVEWCFTINALSYGAVLISLFMIDQTALRTVVPVRRRPGQLREGFRYCWDHPRIRLTLILTVVVSSFAWNWNVLLPEYATSVLGGDAALYGSLASLLGVGSFTGALLTTRRSKLGGRHLRVSGMVLAASLLVTALAPALPVAILGLILLGAAGTSFSVGAQTRLQLNADEAMNGRVMALYSVGFAGSKPVGGLLGGWIMDVLGARQAFGFGGIIVTVAVGIIALTSRRRRRFS